MLASEGTADHSKSVVDLKCLIKAAFEQFGFPLLLDSNFQVE